MNPTDERTVTTDHRTRRIDGRTFWLLAGLFFCLAFPSFGKVQRFLGMGWVVAYGAAAFLALLVGYRYLLSAFLRRLTEKGALALAAATLVLLVAGFVVVYPTATSGVVGGGSDRDEALNIGVTELLHGRYPYYARTRVEGVFDSDEGGPLSPMPGGLFLATPFVLMGNSAYQNFFWLIVLFFVVRRHLGDGRLALLFLWLILFAAPVGLHEVMSGGDLLPNSIWVLVFSILMVGTVSSPTAGLPARVLASVLFGVGLSSRIHFVLVGPLVLSMLVQTAGGKEAVKFMAVAALACLAVTLPFYLYDPAHFTPFGLVEGRFGRFESFLPHAQVIVPGIGVLLTGVLSFQKMDGKCVVLFRNCAVVIAWLIVATVVLWSVSVGRVDFEKRAWYGVSFMLFGALSCLAGLAGTSAPISIGPGVPQGSLDRRGNDRCRGS